MYCSKFFTSVENLVVNAEKILRDNTEEPWSMIFGHDRPVLLIGMGRGFCFIKS